MGGDDDCNVYQDAISLLAPLTAASQDFWDSLETEPCSDNPWDDADSSSSSVSSGCDSTDSDVSVTCHTGSKLSVRQVYYPVLPISDHCPGSRCHQRG